MKFTNKTFYSVGIVASACNLLGSAIYLLGHTLGLLFTVGSVLSAAMMLFLAGYEKKDRKKQAFFVAASMLSLLGLLEGWAGLFGGIFSWPLFALWFFLDTKGQESTTHTMSLTVMICGAAQFIIAAFMSAFLTARVAGCVAFVVAAVQGVFAWILYQNEKAIMDAQPDKSKLA